LAVSIEKKGGKTKERDGTSHKGLNGSSGKQPHYFR
jgi:hypothetical protein